MRGGGAEPPGARAKRARRRRAVTFKKEEGSRPFCDTKWRLLRASHVTSHVGQLLPGSQQPSPRDL